MSLATNTVGMVFLTSTQKIPVCAGIALLCMLLLIKKTDQRTPQPPQIQVAGGPVIA